MVTDKLRYTENWYRDVEEAAVLWSLSQVEADGAFIEIGSFEGKSTVSIANAIYPKILCAVDTWKGGSHSGYELSKYNTTPIEANFKNNIEVGTEGNVRAFKMDWETFITDILNSTIAFLYLDGPHDYDSVLRSLEIIVPLMNVGSVLVGDDYDDQSVKGAVFDFFGESMDHPKIDRMFHYKLT